MPASELTRLETQGNNLPACLRDMLMHYSFDFAQHVHCPADPLQPGPVYFKTPPKRGVLGIIIMTEALPQMILFLLEEAVETEKGADTTISMLDLFFQYYGFKERGCHQHADNCSGQNKTMPCFSISCSMLQLAVRKPSPCPSCLPVIPRLALMDVLGCSRGTSEEHVLTASMTSHR